MKLRREPLGKLVAERQDIVRALEKAKRDREQSGTLADQATADMKKLARDPAAREEAEKARARHRKEIIRFDDVVALYEADLADVDHRIEHARFAERYAALEEAAHRQFTAAEKVFAPIGTACKFLADLEAARADFAQAVAGARELCPEDVEFELPAEADERELPEDVKALIMLLKEGARRPIAEQASARERTERQRRTSAKAVAQQAVRDALVAGDFSRLEQLSPDDRRLAVAIAERETAELLAQIASPSGERLGVAGPVDRQRPALERRLDRVRQLASEADVEVEVEVEVEVAA